MQIEKTIQPNWCVQSLYDTRSHTPEMDVWGLLSTIQDNPEIWEIPAVAVTVFHSVSVIQEAIRAGFQAYFTKSQTRLLLLCENSNESWTRGDDPK